MKYAPANPKLLTDAAWLQRFLTVSGVSAEALSHVLGVNQARVWEWLNCRRPMPVRVRQTLEAWAAAGYPCFEYWIH